MNCHIWPRTETSLLMEALQTRNSNLVWSILEADADVNYSTESRWFSGYPETAILEAARWGDHTILEDLIDRGADVNASVVLTVSVKRKDTSLVKVLLDAGANVNDDLSKKAGTSALKEAVRNSDIEMTELLLAHGADPNDSNAPLTAMLYSKPLFEKLLGAPTKKYPCG